MFKVKRSRAIFFVLFSLFCSSCDEIFLRFSHEKYFCEDNRFLIKEISVTQTSKNSTNVVLIDDTEFLFNVITVSDNSIIIKNRKLDISLTINKTKNKVFGFYKKNSFGLTCVKKSFRI
tara:strand:- start:201 stop:557 length:357 start_codon:yes stop_codon:yes gene_type:complete